VRKRSFALLAAATIVFAFAFQGSRGLYESSEGRYAEVAREMRESGNYLEPTVDYRPHWTKPPLTYWAIAGGLAVVGENPWGVRAYNAIAFAVTTLAVAAAGAALWNATTGLLAGVVYLSSLYPVAGANVATADTLLAMWEALALLAYVHAWKGRRSSMWVRAMWLMFGLAFFTKGPPALLPLLALVVFHAVARRPFRLADPLGIALFVVSGFWWYALMVARHPELWSYFVMDEVIARSARGVFRRNGGWYGAFDVYLPVVLTASGVWIVEAVRAARRRRLFAPRTFVRALFARASAGSLLLLWIVLPLACFVLSRSRLPLYLLPLYPAVALAIARGMSAGADLRAVRRRAARLAAVSTALLLAVKAIAAYIPSDKDATRLYREVVAVAGADAQLALINEPTEYGFQFYAGGGLLRVSRTGSEPWSEGTLSQVLALREPFRPLALVMSPKRDDDVARELEHKRVPFERYRVTGKVVLTVPASAMRASH
jgi:4-amino-4-deoxy-L-arabinose transferase-like glycosyltransferase